MFKLIVTLGFVLMAPCSALAEQGYCCAMFLGGELKQGAQVCRATLEEARDASSGGFTGNDLHSRCRQINRTGFGRHCEVRCFSLDSPSDAE